MQEGGHSLSAKPIWLISHLCIPIIGVWTAEFSHLDNMQTQPWQPDRPRYHLTAFSGGWISGANRVSAPCEPCRALPRPDDVPPHAARRCMRLVLLAGPVAPVLSNTAKLEQVSQAARQLPSAWTVQSAQVAMCCAWCCMCKLLCQVGLGLVLGSCRLEGQGALEGAAACHRTHTRRARPGRLLQRVSSGCTCTTPSSKQGTLVLLKLALSHGWQVVLTTGVAALRRRRAFRCFCTLG